MQISVTPAVEGQCRARGIERADIDYAVANPSYDIPVAGMRDLRQIVANIGPGRLFLRYRKVNEREGVLVEGYWNPKK